MGRGRLDQIPATFQAAKYPAGFIPMALPWALLLRPVGTKKNQMEATFLSKLWNLDLLHELESELSWVSSITSNN